MFDARVNNIVLDYLPKLQAAHKEYEALRTKQFETGPLSLKAEREKRNAQQQARRAKKTEDQKVSACALSQLHSNPQLRSVGCFCRQLSVLKSVNRHKSAREGSQMTKRSRNRYVSPWFTNSWFSGFRRRTDTARR